MNDSCLSKQVERCPWPAVSLISVRAANPRGLPHLGHIWRARPVEVEPLHRETNPSLIHSLNSPPLPNTFTRPHHSLIKVYCFSRFIFSFVLTKPWSLDAALLQDFLRADETADIRGNKHNAVITSHLSSVERIIWTRFGLWGVTGRCCYGNQTKAVSYIAPYRSSASMRAHTHTHTHRHTHTHAHAHTQTTQT